MKLFAVLLLFIGNSFAEGFHFSSINFLTEQEVGRIVLPQIYSELGIVISITPLPAQRAQLSATSGVSDGEIMRIFSYGIENPTTIRVPTPYYYLETTAFVHKDKDIVIENKDHLEKYFVAKVRGVKHTNRITEGHSQVIDMNSTIEIMRMVDSGRVDVALTNTIDGLMALKELGLKNVIAIKKPLATFDLYHYIHLDHKHLVPIVDAKIIEMTKDGKLAKIVNAAEQKTLLSKYQTNE
ncbi:transporter substrate-binding domain-containing protein [Psychrosphaera sp. 1_MG-2023]|uniref:substrate-binding periplasmic protein n=1 Tax=Psychrosphaera sp. 1_MG-2023 TaxID=3062643 RepID=UPI0026E19397|nr:transporter substrate-binding domain-containing protein [Psychrosphaera sp. 1_MG-2023]MDO6719663.1 transporter substrate-binding domain-containing protein [Psychrosphaera sp. 1_MG-2023]